MTPQAYPTPLKKTVICHLSSEGFMRSKQLSASQALTKRDIQKRKERNNIFVVPPLCLIVNLDA